MFLTMDLTIEVFVRLPIKSLGRFKSVCKNWNAIICSLGFAKLHLQHAINTHPKDDDLSPNLFFLNYKYVRHRLFTFRTELLKVEQMKLTHTYYVGSYPIGSSNGLICFKSYYRLGVDCLYIWNPTIQEYSCIGQRSRFFIRTLPVYWGFGYDPLSDDYKIVCLGIACDQTRTPVACIFTSRTCQWRQLECPSHDGMNEFLLKNVDLRGPKNLPVLVGHTLYWRLDQHKFDPKYLLAFDLMTDSFETIPLPTQIPRASDRCKTRDFFICQISQCLCACWVWTELLVVGEDEDFRLCMDVRTMERRGEDVFWKSKFTFERFIDCLPGDGPILPKLFEFKENSKYMIIYSGFKSCYVIDLNSKPENVISTKGVEGFKFDYDKTGTIYALDCTHSLVSPIHHLTYSVEARGAKRSCRRQSGTTEARPYRKLKYNVEAYLN
ncbi:hypothetical protein RND81_11G190300 [Saponaria officinalis]|uniref:F-box domain-containing protein n=1 Tax=Saponaria officinalis TaxID=3572 RepID=A0AAW1HNX9_SAPOF